jgi:hypothetical protein
VQAFIERKSGVGLMHKREDKIQPLGQRGSSFETDVFVVIPYRTPRRTVWSDTNADGNVYNSCKPNLHFAYILNASHIIIISSSKVIVRTMTASHTLRFRNLIKNHGRTPLDE